MWLDKGIISPLPCKRRLLLRYVWQSKPTVLISYLTTFDCERVAGDYFWSQIRSIETQNVSYMLLFVMWCGFETIMSSERKMLPDFYAFPINLIDVRTVKFFAPSESWLVNLNFSRASGMRGKKHRTKETAKFQSYFLTIFSWFLYWFVVRRVIWKRHYMYWK